MQSDGHQFFLRARWFWQQLCAKKYPNTTKLIEKFEISRPTAERLIELLRNDYHAPLSYDDQHRGFQLDDPDWQLPFLPISTDEILAVALARQHLRQASEGFLSGLLETYWDRLIKEIEDKTPREVLDDSLYSVADPRNWVDNYLILLDDRAWRSQSPRCREALSTEDHSKRGH